MGARHRLSDEQIEYLMELWCKYHNRKHICTIELTAEEAAVYEQETAQGSGT